jgi:hypothetical protein
MYSDPGAILHHIYQDTNRIWYNVHSLQDFLHILIKKIQIAQMNLVFSYMYDEHFNENYVK